MTNLTNQIARIIALDNGGRVPYRTTAEKGIELVKKEMGK